MSLGEGDAFHLALKELAGEVKDSEVIHGGDLSALPVSKEQQEILLNLTEVADRAISCTLPVTSISANISKGVIFGVPIPDKEEEILAALSSQNVTHVKRLPMKGHPDIHSETVILTFSSPIPDRVKIAAMSFRVKQSISNPFRCRNCWLLGHPSSRCGSNTLLCKKCGKSHPPGIPCSTNYVNCHSSSHESDSDTCPAYLEMKALLKMAATHGISIKEARMQHNRLFSKAVQRAPPASAPSLPPLIA